MSTVLPRLPRLMRLGPPIVLIGHRCKDCGRAAFPPDPYGCEDCGADVGRLSPIDLEARGVIHSLATVHRHHQETPTTPFTVATVVLDDGPTLKAVLIGDMAADGAAVGHSVVGVTEITDHDDEGNELVDLRFELEES